LKLIIPLEEQLISLSRGSNSLELVRPATLNDGISKLSQSEITQYRQYFELYNGVCSMFIPASGAASRMFGLLTDLENSDSDEKLYFIDHVLDLPFFESLELSCQNIYNQTIKSLLEKGELKKLSNLILDSQGLNFGALPKGLIPIRKRKEELKTSFQEQILEVNALFSDKINGQLHFSIPENFKNDILENIEKQSIVEVQLSIQRQETNTISLDSKGGIFNDSNGKPITRPGGHGALIHNLNEIDADIIFIKNIDNITRLMRLEDQINWKQTLGGFLIALQRQIHQFQLDFTNDNLDSNEVVRFFKSNFYMDLASADIPKVLYRPVRVCGMVKNEGLPGGGPYFIKKGNRESLQIVEAAEIDKTNNNQLEILNASTHFNPVDVVCGVRNFKGEKYNLLDFVDDSAFIITHKKLKSESLTVLELPGLWNGSMSNWNTVFIEAPSFTFNPVKTVNDLVKNVD